VSLNVIEFTCHTKFTQLRASSLTFMA